MKNIFNFFSKDKKIFEVINIYKEDFSKTQKALFNYKKDLKKYKTKVFDSFISDHENLDSLERGFLNQFERLTYNDSSMPFLFEELILTLNENKNKVNFFKEDFFIPRFVSNEFLEKGYIPEPYLDKVKIESRKKEVNYFNKEHYTNNYEADFFYQDSGYYNFKHWYNQTVLFFLEKYNKYQQQKAFIKTFNHSLKDLNDKYFEMVESAYKEMHLRLDTLKRYLEGSFLIYLPDDLFNFDINDIEQSENINEFFEERFSILNILVFIAQNHGDSPKKVLLSEQFTQENKLTVAKYEELLYNNVYFDKKILKTKEQPRHGIFTTY